MKIFVVTADVELVDKPSWLDDFRRKYDKPYEYHLTLKQPCVIDEAEVPKIQGKLKDLFTASKFEGIYTKFDTLKISDAPGGKCIMINASDADQVKYLQKQVTSILSDYKNYYKSQYQAYEENFEPHITIGRDLDEQLLNEASKQLTQNYECTGKVNKVILTVVSNFGPEEANDPKNQTIYNLQDLY